MKVKKYRDDIGITKEKWEEIYFNKEIIKEKDREFLEFFYSKGGKASATDLTVPYGESSSKYNKRVGNLGKRIARYFNIEKIPKREDGKPQWWNILFYGERREKFIWELRPELREVIAKLKDTIIIDEEVKLPYPYNKIEGGIKSVILNKYERNTKARKECLDYYGYNCYVCEENLKDKYGILGKNFIHVHHELPLSERKNEYEVDGIKDLKPVCPNCHSIIHRKKPCFKIEEIRNELRNWKKEN